MIIRKIIIHFILLALFLSCNTSKSMLTEKQDSKNNFTKVSGLISSNEFEEIKEFILKNGNRITYRNFDNNNPHYKFKSCDIFLGADIGQRNINNDPETSDFNQLIIADRDSNIKYYELVTVRKGDLAAAKAWTKKGMKEKQVYLVDGYGKGLKLMQSNLSNYLEQIKEEVTTINSGNKK